MTYDFATRIKRIEAELMALKIAQSSGGGATVYDSEVTLTQGGVSKGSFTVNQSSDSTIALDAGGSVVSYSPSLVTGTAVGDLTIDGTTTTLYAPTPAGVTSSNLIFHGTCSTATGTAEKVATLDDSTGFTLTNGILVAITFTNANVFSSSGASERTLNVNGTGAKTILDYATTGGDTRVGSAIWMAGETVEFVYDSGTDGWMRVGGAPSYVRGSGLANFTLGNMLFQFGEESANSSGTTDVAVAFDAEFQAVPQVFLTNNFNEGGSSFWWAFVKSRSTTGFVLRSGYKSLTSSSGGGNSSAKIAWMAVGFIKGSS